MLDLPSCGIKTEKRARVVWDNKEETHRYLTFFTVHHLRLIKANVITNEFWFEYGHKL